MHMFDLDLVFAEGNLLHVEEKAFVPGRLALPGSFWYAEV